MVDTSTTKKVNIAVFSNKICFSSTSNKLSYQDRSICLFTIVYCFIETFYSLLLGLMFSRFLSVFPINFTLHIIYLRFLIYFSAFIVYYAFQTSFFWLNVMCFDIWRTFRWLSFHWFRWNVNKTRLIFMLMEFYRFFYKSVKNTFNDGEQARF